MPPAVRTSSPGWRDPRLWIGIAIVAASVLVGARVLAAADDTVQVWAVTDDAAVGQELTADDLEARRLRFADDADLERYVQVGDELPADLVLSRALGAGELLPRSALGAPDDGDTVTISLAVTPQLVPSGVGPGSVVHVYVAGDTAPGSVPAPSGSGQAAAPEAEPGPVLEEVRVVAASAGDELGGGDRQVELAVPVDEVSDFYAYLDSLTTPVVSLAQVS